MKFASKVDEGGRKGEERGRKGKSNRQNNSMSVGEEIGFKFIFVSCIGVVKITGYQRVRESVGITPPQTC